MIRILATFMVAGLIALPAAAAPAFEAVVHTGAPQRIAIGEITPGPALAGKADVYGEREIDHLIKVLRNSIEHEFGKAGLLGDTASAGAVLAVVIEDAKPNRPTAAQLAAAPRSPDIRSISRGGAQLTAVLTSSDQAELATFAYRWESPDAGSSHRAVTWTDAERTFGRFARHAAKAMAETR